MEVESSQAPSQPMDFYNLANWFHRNRNRVIITAVVIFVIGAIIAIVMWHNDKTEADANAALMALPSTYSGNASRAHPTASTLDQIAKEYPGTPAAEHAELLAASVLFSDGKYSDSEAAFKKFIADHANSPLVAQANLGVAASLEAAGKTQDAVTKYQDVIGHYPNDNYIVNPAKLTLARLLEQQNKPDQALRYYDELMRNATQYDPWAGEARDRRDQLLAKHPELNKPAVSATPTGQPTPGTVLNGGSTKQPQTLQIPQKATPAPAPVPAKK
jgi:predicted negative regulator of RcsB-dependent stress response